MKGMYMADKNTTKTSDGAHSGIGSDKDDKSGTGFKEIDDFIGD